MTDSNNPLDALAAKPSLEFRRRDADGNGVLDPVEFVGDNIQADTQAKLKEFQTFDVNGDGVLTDAELKAGRKAQRN